MRRVMSNPGRFAPFATQTHPNHLRRTSAVGPSAVVQARGQMYPDLVVDADRWAIPDRHFWARASGWPTNPWAVEVLVTAVLVC